MTPVRKRWLPLAFFLAFSVLFFFANRAAYKGYFFSDDLDKLGWPTLIPIQDYYREILSPKFSPLNFRPIGYLYYRFLGNTFHLYFPPYIAVLQAFHLLNVILVFLLLRRLRFSEFAAGAGALLYMFHAAVIFIYWRPEYIFEVLCSGLCLITMLLYVRGRWLVALIPFWLAYKSKEIAVTLPAALLAIEWFLGERKWKRLIPYFLISLSFGLQAVWHNRSIAPEAGYALRFSPAVLWNSVAFYSSAIFFVPFAGLLLLLLPFFVRDRRLYVGLIFMVSLFVPMLVLPSRQESVYWYIPMIGLTMVLAAIAVRTPRWAMVLFFVFWLPLNYAMLRPERRSLLAVADQHRWYMTGLLQYARRVPPLKAVVFAGTPEYMGSWGVEGGIRLAFGNSVDAVWYHSPRAQEAMAEIPMAIVDYNPMTHALKGMLRTHRELQSYIRFSDVVPEPQFGEGWGGAGADPQRWISSQADVTLYRSAESKQFEIVVSGPAEVTVLEDGRSLGSRTLSGPGTQTLRWVLDNAAAGNKKITIQTHDRPTVVQAFGYVQS